MNGSDNNPVDTAISQGDNAAPAMTSRWKLVGWAVLWTCVVFLAAAGMGFFVGVVVGVVRLDAHIGAANVTRVYAIAGIIGAVTASVWLSLRNGTVVGRGDVRNGLGDAPVSRPILVAFICIFFILYASIINLGLFHARPAVLQQAVGWNWWLLGPMFLFSGIVGPAAEELFFRGWMWSSLRQRWGGVATAAITSGLWLVVHFPEGVAHVTLLVPLAIALPLARQFGRSIRAPILVHTCNNVAASAAPWFFLWLGWLKWPV